jgi:(1->4)-alpha-D-glucan 1-alpha-D-glucosylmutase
MLYQMIVGAWPPGLSPSDAKACQAFAERLATWQQKALREAKLHTDWTAPDQIYETRARDFLFGLFVPANGFLSLAYAFVEVIAPTGAVNGLVQTALKMTVAGMPDFFQGTEFWDFSLVDPDNRRPVDYAIRRDALAANAAPVACLQSWCNGLVKQAVIRNVLGLRRELPNLFARGDYRPLQVNGALAEKIVAFTRSFDGSALIVVAPRLTHALLRKDSIVLDPDRLQANTLSLPEHLQGRSFRSALSSDSVIVAEAELELGSMLTDFPLAILYQNEIA